MAHDATQAPEAVPSDRPGEPPRVPVPSAPIGGGLPAAEGALPERPLTVPARPPGRLARVPDVTSVALTVVGAGSGLTAISTAARGLLAPIQVPTDLLLINASPNLATAAFYGVLAAAAERRKRIGWWGIAVLGGLALLGGGALAVPGALDRLGGVAVVLAVWFGPPDALDAETLSQMPARPVATALVAVQAVVFAVFLAARRHFPTRVRRGAPLRALLVLVLGIAVLTVLGFALVSVFPGNLATETDRLVWTLSEVTGPQFAADIPGFGTAPNAVNLVLGLFGLVALLTALLVLTRSQRAASILTPQAERQVRELLAAHGDAPPLSYFAPRRDKAAIFSPSGKAAVTYRVVAGVSLASGDPVGDPDHWAPAIRRWITEARTYAWIPAAMGASTAGATAYHRGGLRVLEIGDEAVLHTDRFDLDHPDLRAVRQTVQRLRRAGYTVRIRRHGALSPQELDRLVELADGWRHGETQPGVSMAPPPPRDPPHPPRPA